MSKLSQTMKMVSGSTTYQIPFYTTTTEAGAYGTYGAANVGGTACYYGFGTGTDVAHGSKVKTPQKVVKGNTTYYMLTKGNAELATYTLKLNAMTTNQTITLKYKNRNITDTGYEAEVTKKSTSSAQSFTVRKGTTWTATVSPSTGWNAGALSPGSSGTVSAATTVSAAAATYKTFTLKLAKQTHQTITLKYKNKKSDGTFDSEVTKKSSSSDQSFTVGYGTTWTATIAGATDWNAGTLSAKSGTVTANVTVTASAATTKYPKGTLLGNDVTSLKIPNSVSYISINAIFAQYSSMTSMSGAGGEVEENGVSVKRVAVTPGTTYADFNKYTGTNDSASYNYGAGYTQYYNHPSLGKVPNNDEDTSYFKIYADTNSGTPYADTTVRKLYKTLKGTEIPA